MIDVRPVVHVIGLLVLALGGTMLIPLVADLIYARDQWGTFASSALITVVAGAVMALSTGNAITEGLTRQQVFLLTTFVWVVLPVFGALPFVLGAPDASFTDAYFEAVSGITTTGSTVFSGLDAMPQGTLMWRGVLQWLGGVGIIVVAIAFLPMLKVGGMQLFQSEGFDTFGKILPRAAEIAGSISVIYLVITLACILSYMWAGLDAFDAIVHAMTTVSTGGFSTKDASLGHFEPAAEWVASVFMILASLPFARYVQMVAGDMGSLFRDAQVRAYIAFLAIIAVVLGYWTLVQVGLGVHQGLRESIFNSISIISGTGYASADYQSWGSFSIVLFFLIGLVGGCAGSTSCSIKIFRFQILWSTLVTQVKRIHSPRGVFTPRYGDKPITEDVINSVMAFFAMFLLTLTMLSILLSLLGLEPITAISGAATALANIGPGLGPEIGPTGNFSGLSDTVKWVLSAAMITGRLELVAVYVLFTAAFWRT
ncbi:TrkH family potassium uptake protein [Oceanomicrobium pacificus]|uniref:Trk system potassium uptake protein n=1 Tax=Oceanomicrobium pacificus TaxID=2692916 RepID=A0A6B0TW83_9RHOB|nr:TrkH family potassium uptake protein [Oceanomicrobium pacificus]MXU65512.1 potassium transporter TrkH [Oceanomicrobium pacificus]